MNTLAETTYIKFGVLIDTPREDTLRQIAFIIHSLISLLSLIIVVWSDLQEILSLIYDVILALDYTTRVVMVIINTFVFALR